MLWQWTEHAAVPLVSAHSHIGKNKGERPPHVTNNVQLKHMCGCDVGVHDGAHVIVEKASLTETAP